MSFISKLFGGDSSPLEKYSRELEEVNSYKEEVANLSQEQIQAEVMEFRKQVSRLEAGDVLQKKLKDIRQRVFALTREAAKRSMGQFHYDVQVAGGMVLSDGKIAEMKTGEGKTLTATLPLVLYALAGKGAHLVTVNDYLARWQASQMGPIFNYLGLSVASIQHEASFLYDPSYQPEAYEIEQIESEVQGLVLDVKHMRPVSRKAAYGADVTYGTNNEYGFDYLRDNMVQHASQLSQREQFFAIVDEVDSILIDEARTPLIISSPDSEPTQKYYDFAKMVEKLQEKEDFEIDEKKKASTLTDAGINKIEKFLNIPNIYDTTKGVATIHHIEQALKAKTLFKLDRDYVVQKGEIVIVDEFTGRLMFGRRYSQGLHQAIEAKEGLQIQAESKTLATITFQNLFRLYFRLAGMTGTAKTEEEEFFKIYKLTVEQIPTNKPMVRGDEPDLVYKTEEAKFGAIAKEVKSRQKAGQPVLIGTVSVAKNEMLAEVLKKEGVRFEILNAKNHEREAHIIAQAGRLGAVTLATNIAGRGVDILLGGNPVEKEDAKRVKEAGGLHVLGTERHESRRIDNQLRGRAGRQGDPGSSQFFVSMEDDLMRLFGGDRMKNLMTSLGLPDDQPIEARLVSRSIEQAQKKIEGLNFDTRKHVLEFDDVLNTQRNSIYKKRRAFVAGTEESKKIDLKAEVLAAVKKEIEELVTLEFSAATEGSGEPLTSINNILQQINSILPVSDDLKKRIIEATKNSADKEFGVIDEAVKEAEKLLDEKEKEMGQEIFEGALRFVSISSLDELWMEHLDTMDHLRDSVRLRGYGQRDPLVEYKREGHLMFQRMLKETNRQIAHLIYKVNVQQQPIQPKPVNLVANNSGQPVSGSANSDPAYEGVGRNDTCPCGSGKKFKKCHGK